MGDLSKHFGWRIQQLRKAARLTQEELGKRSKMEGKHVGEVERGERNPTLETVERLLRALQAEPYEAFSFNLVRQPSPDRTLDEETLLSLVRKTDMSLHPLLVQLMQDVLRWAHARKKR